MNSLQTLETPIVSFTASPKTAVKKAYLFENTSGSKPAILRHYDHDFRPDAQYLDSLPDMTDTVDAIDGANVPIQQVGIHGFKLPLRFAMRNGEILTLEAKVTGTVSLEVDKKGINMSRIIRRFYEYKAEIFGLNTLEGILRDYAQNIGGFQARLKVALSVPLLVPSLRSGLEGYQFYNITFEAFIDSFGHVRRFVELDFTYSSACPCSAELAEHARENREAYAIPHSQRSKARIKVEIMPDMDITVEDLVEHMRKALKTETQVMVKREDEQAFAELNGAYVKFVEDAARLVFEQLDADVRIRDFQVACSHLESLHSHDAVSVICKGVRGGFQADFAEFDQLVC